MHARLPDMSSRSIAEAGRRGVRPALEDHRQAGRPGAGLARPAPKRPWNALAQRNAATVALVLTSTRWLSAVLALPIGTPP